MNTTIADVLSARKRSVGSAVVPQVSDVEDGEDTKTEPTVTTMADSVRPLLISMKLFGLYFKCGARANDNVTEKKSRRHWNGYMIYGLIVVILFWINMARIFSVFKNIIL